jgi:hypothetical protein
MVNYISYHITQNSYSLRIRARKAWSPLSAAGDRLPSRRPSAPTPKSKMRCAASAALTSHVSKHRCLSGESQRPEGGFVRASVRSGAARCPRKTPWELNGCSFLVPSLPSGSLRVDAPSLLSKAAPGLQEGGPRPSRADPETHKNAPMCSGTPVLRRPTSGRLGAYSGLTSSCRLGRQ